MAQRAMARAPIVRAVLAAALLLLLGSWSLHATPAAAHAVLTSTDPADGAQLDEAPERVTLTFNEPVDVPADGVRVFDADATRVDRGPAETDAPELVAVELPPELPDGGYVVTYRVTSADSHPITGVIAFAVGGGAAVDDALVADLFGGAGQDWPGVVGPVLRALAYLGTLLAAGAAAFAAWVATRREEVVLARTWSLRAIVVAAAATVLAVPVQTVAVTGRRLAEVFAPGGGLVDVAVFSSFGQSTLLRIVGLSALVLAWQRLRVDAPRTRGVHVEVLVCAALAATSFALDGHQRTIEPLVVLAGADLVHLLAGATWLGGLVLLTIAVRQRAIDDDPVGAARLVARFSRVAVWSVLALAAAGVAMSLVLVRSPRALVATDYGWTLVAKLAVTAVVLAAAAYNRFRLEPAIAARAVPAGAATDTGELAGAERLATRSRAAWRQLRATLVVEVVGLVVVLGITGFLVTQRPAAEAAGITAPFEATAPLGDELQVDVLIDPNRVGRNALHVYVLDPSGRPAGEVDDLRLELTYVPEAIGPIPVEPFVSGPGHWTAYVDDLRFPGEWRIRVVAGVDRFTEHEAEVSATINP